MNGRISRLFLGALCTIILGFIPGCEQPENVIAPTSATELTLNPERLIDPPDGYAYALWLVDTLGEETFIDVFDWDSELYKFRDTLGNELDNVWEVDINVLDPLYEFVALSVEKLDGMRQDSVGPIMLRDTIIDPSEYTMKMTYPINLWDGIGSFCMETPTDGNSNSNEGSGVWLAVYVYDSIFVSDTLNINNVNNVSPQLGLQGNDRDLIYDTTFWVCNDPGWSGGACSDSTFVPKANITSEDDYDLMTIDSLGNLDVTYFVCNATGGGGECVDSTGYDRTTVINDGIEYEWIVVNTLDTIGFINEVCDQEGVLLVSPSVFNNEVDTVWLDTMEYDYCTFDWFASPVNILEDNRVDTIRFEDGDPVEFTVEPFTDYLHAVNYTINTDIEYIDRFVTGFDLETVADLTGTGWHYRGWVLSPNIDKATYGELTRPMWSTPSFYLWLNPVDAGIISTGAFYSFDGPDIDNENIEANPYSDPSNSRVPPFPGEDFVNMPGGGTLDLVENNSPEGFVFITLEPDNYWDANTNFPLVLFSARLPQYGIISNPLPHQNGNFDFTNLFSSVSGSNMGLPAINLEISTK